MIDLVSVAYASIQHEVQNANLQDVGMYFTDTLEGVKPPPSPSPEDYD